MATRLNCFIDSKAAVPKREDYLYYRACRNCAFARDMNRDITVKVAGKGKTESYLCTHTNLSVANTWHGATFCCKEFHRVRGDMWDPPEKRNASLSDRIETIKFVFGEKV